MSQPKQDPLAARFPQRGRAPAEAPAPLRDPEPLPSPTGQAPYQMTLNSILPPDEVTEIGNGDHLAFHMVGDVGGIKRPEYQLAVAGAMANDAHSPHDPARFLYLMGDVVYYNGEAGQYYPQFYEPYADYPAPIFSVPGNHDGTPLDGSSRPGGLRGELLHPQLRRVSPDARDVAPADDDPAQRVLHPADTVCDRLSGCTTTWSMTATSTTTQQHGWSEQMRAASSDLPLILASHHPMLSLDQFHGPSAIHGSG